MLTNSRSLLPKLFDEHHVQLAKSWLASQRGAGVGDDQVSNERFQRFIAALKLALASGRIDDVSAPEFASARDVLEEIAREGALKGSSPTETATFVFSLKAPLFDLLRGEIGEDAKKLASEIWIATELLDRLGLYTTEVFQKSREEVISRQQAELMELSTPVVQLWDGILAVPLIGTLDSARTQSVMENLLQEIITSEAEIAIIDITGVPTVDTMVAQHLLKTVSAARLMGADCIISGIRPQIAQTIVHLGVELNVISKATMADAFGLALRRIGKMVVDRPKPGNGKVADAAAVNPAS